MANKFQVLLLGARNPQEETRVFSNREDWLAAAKASAEKVGNPIATLNTPGIKRFLFGNGRSVDWVTSPMPADAPFMPRVLTQHVLGLRDGRNPSDVADEFIRDNGRRDEYWKWTRPDPAFPDGDIVMVLRRDSVDRKDPAYYNRLRMTLRHDDIQYQRGHIFRRASLRLGKDPALRPRPFTGWPK